MKKIIAALLSSVLMLSFVGCSNVNQAEEKNMSLAEELGKGLLESSSQAESSDEVETKAKAAEKNGNGNVASGDASGAAGGNRVAAEKSNVSKGDGFDAQKVLEKIEIVKTYDVQSYGYTQLVLLVENKSDYDCEVGFTMDFYDASGKIVDTKDQSINAFAAHSTAAVRFSTDEAFSKYEYKYTVTKLSDYYVCVTNQLETKVDTTKDKAIVSVTNNSQHKASVTAGVLFFNGDKLVNYGVAYVGDSDYNIQPGKTERGTESCFDDFTSVEVYVSGYATNY